MKFYTNMYVDNRKNRKQNSSLTEDWSADDVDVR